MKERILKNKKSFFATGLILLLIFTLRFPFTHGEATETKDIKKLEAAQVQIVDGAEKDELEVISALITEEEKKLYNLSIEHRVTMLVALVLGASLAVSGLLLGRNKTKENNITGM